jgi:hypothetical protein
MPTGYGRQEPSDEVTAPLKSLLELYASQSERLGTLSNQMASVVSALKHLSGHIGERLDEAQIPPGLLKTAARYARPKDVTPSAEYGADKPTSGQSGNAASIAGVVYPQRAYGAPYPPPGSLAAPIFLPDADIRQAKCGNVVLVVGNGSAAYSADGGNTLTPLNLSTTFPLHAGDGWCCDQAAQYLPGIDRFVWLMQFSAGTNGQNCLRIAAASPREIICTKCTGWTYWDVSTTQPGLNAGMNHSEISVRHNVLCITIGQRESALFLVEIPLDAIRTGGPIHWRLSAQPDSAHSRADSFFSVTGQGHGE